MEILHFRRERSCYSHLRPVRLVEWPGPDFVPADLHELSWGLYQRQLQQSGSPSGQRCRLVTFLVQSGTRSINKAKPNNGDCVRTTQRCRSLMNRWNRASFVCFNRSPNVIKSKRRPCKNHRSLNKKLKNYSVLFILIRSTWY